MLDGSSRTTTPSTAAKSSRARSGVMGARVSTWTASEWATNTGIADRRARDPQVRQVEDLPALVDELHLLLRVAVLDEDVDLGQRVERDLVRVDRDVLRLAGHVGADLALELADRAAAGPDTAW